ncbi:Transporter [Candidatus Methylobacter favarea]|uniref:Transporter n=1 Tax=Candidatus Methylobacter favarea TaxID=2707345 RepID=A0A8S0WLE1_9GAMM|nr:AEC family transporter [Candidatus Methylobacter favarea]CAA9892560.1 Transporter [Candidatus Methylobacter favarea]
MTSTLIQMAVLIACGAVWRIIKPGSLSAEQTRPVLTTVVYYLFLPAMILEVLWTSKIGLQSLQYTLLGVASLFVGMLCIWLAGRAFKFENKQFGAMLLAAIFPNVTYLGLPVLEQTFGAWARSVAIQIDLFATSPVLFTAGIMAARHYGEDNSGKHPSVLSFLNAPPFWTAIIAVLLNLNNIAMPGWLAGILQKLSAGVVPIMLFSLGLALSWRAVTYRNLPFVLPVILIKMVLMPWFALWFVGLLTLGGGYKAAAVLDIAMPSMVLGIVFCDRYHLDSSLYAMAVTVTTALSLVMLPFWHGILMKMSF